jgi:hypothetical protein
MRPSGATAARATHEVCVGLEQSPAHLAANQAIHADVPGGSGPVKAMIGSACVTLEKDTGMAASQRVNVPISSYRGITLALGERSVLTLLHEVEDFCVTLAVYDPLHDNDQDILNAGERWAAQLGCKLLLEEQQAQNAMSQNAMSLATMRPRARRANSFFAARRPRFLTKRSTGGAPAAPRIQGAREIIARG